MHTTPSRVCTSGSSGSGKTTFLNNVHDLHKCTYVRQYHTLRPYLPVCKIPAFDPTQLPYWKLYSEKTFVGGGGMKNVSYNPNVKIGGTLAGEPTHTLTSPLTLAPTFTFSRLTSSHTHHSTPPPCRQVHSGSVRRPAQDE